MKHWLCTLLLVQTVQVLSAQESTSFQPGFSLGTRVTFSPLHSASYMGNGIGGQARIHIKPQLNTEWFLSYLTSSTSLTAKNTWYIGWAVLLYPKNNTDFSKRLQPFLSVGHCFDKTTVSEKADPTNRASRLTMALHAGAGTHINLLERLDCTIAPMYLMHLGKDIETELINGKPYIHQAAANHFDGHLMINISFNYRFSGS